MISFIKRVIIAIRIVLSKSKEPFFKFNYIINYVKNGYFFPSYEKVDYRPLIKIEMDENFKYVIFKGKRICYPKSWTNWLITENFNNLINEQTAVGANVNPHKYLSNSELKKEWVIYDIGAAEGSQSKLWIDDVKHIVLFEPLPSFFIQLQNTFKAEIDAAVTLME
ncbi:MAG: hypothetical protein IPH89_08290 [Bacteroidetes bacterium]|nr:hypothetical protein [Bacteroidota bacterium]